MKSDTLKKIDDFQRQLAFRDHMTKYYCITKQKISRELSNIDTYKCKKGIRETFWMFYFLPVMACLITGFILMILHIDWYFLIPAVLLTGYALQNMLFFMKYGKRKKNFHAGSE